jgi:hypothetical protein
MVKNQAKQGGQLSWDSLTTGGGVVRFLANFFIFFYLHLPSAAFICLHLPSLVKVPKGFFGGIFDRPARAACAGWRRQRIPPSPATMAR